MCLALGIWKLDLKSTIVCAVHNECSPLLNGETSQFSHVSLLLQQQILSEKQCMKALSKSLRVLQTAAMKIKWGANNRTSLNYFCGFLRTCNHFKINICKMGLNRFGKCWTLYPPVEHWKSTWFSKGSEKSCSKNNEIHFRGEGGNLGPIFICNSFTWHGLNYLLS